MHISGSTELITMIWVSLERSFPLAELSTDDANLVKGDDVRRKTKANACHGWSWLAQESMG